MQFRELRINFLLKNSRNGLLSILFVFFLSDTLHGQSLAYKQSFMLLDSMLIDASAYSFKKAVFSVENAYLNGKLDTLYLNRHIKVLTQLAKGLIKNRQLLYHQKDIEKVKVYAALFSIMTDTIPIVNSKKGNLVYTPYQYDFDDPFGHVKWENMFVSKLLKTRKGNCHSLPYLYKILAEELDAEAHLALAPNHVYIKHYTHKNGWYNTELTSGVFPHDAWLMASGYVHLNAIKNGVFLKALNNKESIALCLVDLALGYTKQADYDPDFVIQCADKALTVFPNLANALVLKVEAKGRNSNNCTSNTNLLGKHQMNYLSYRLSNSK